MDLSWIDVLLDSPWMRNGKNFIEIVTNIDVGREEFWSACLMWEDGTVRAYTQYNPPFVCDHECDHFPRNHIDDCELDYQGELIVDGKDVI